VPLTSNTLGNMYALTVLAPIMPGSEDNLRAYLEGFRDQGSPLARLPRTHFGRWVIVPNFVRDPKQRKGDDLGCAYLLFTSTFDGALDSYLEELSELDPEAERIWGHCIGSPEPARGAELKAYLLHNQIDTGLFFSACADASVGKVRQSLDKRDKTIAVAVRSQGMDVASLQQEFLKEFGI
jgi:hypothetical protein